MSQNPENMNSNEIDEIIKDSYDRFKIIIDDSEF